MRSSLFGPAPGDYVLKADTAYLLLACSKKDQEDLCAVQPKALMEVLKELTDG